MSTFEYADDAAFVDVDAATATARVTSIAAGAGFMKPLRLTKARLSEFS